MMITFRSRVTPDVVMLRDLAQYLLGLVGKRLDTRGVILRDELPGAINRLEAAISDDDKAQAALEALHYTRDRNEDAGGGLAKRAWPFLDMMREAYRQNADIIWGL
ncbi:DUF1840 domain-containing protein [Paraburkholderia sp. SARCC-3016]|uniref:DUF1840 domain-containing protein n=1 Tax=Paraburkholderia sp. SARCC-3016 TaxID=3058611 RepID=UPI00280A0BBB|nr:DUF1840 domain-containing protein [Paraburkholderia sp. SARCC-3016]MDQ7978333.1 DUF1840 domain-containing protein [Paraburkholderia sp. SARCC-3016]